MENTSLGNRVQVRLNDLPDRIFKELSCEDCKYYTKVFLSSIGVTKCEKNQPNASGLSSNRHKWSMLKTIGPFHGLTE